MTVQQLIASNASFAVTASYTPLSETFHALIEFSILASKTDPFNPMEKTIHALGEYYLTDTEHLHQFAPLTPYQLALSFAAGLCSVVWFELLKFIRRH